MKKIKIEEIISLKKRLNEINSYKLNEIDFIDFDGNKIDVNPEYISEFEFTGLSNVDFIITDFYKKGFETELISNIKPINLYDQDKIEINGLIYSNSIENNKQKF